MIIIISIVERHWSFKILHKINQRVFSVPIEPLHSHAHTLHLLTRIGRLHEQNEGFSRRQIERERGVAVVATAKIDERVAVEYALRRWPADSVGVIDTVLIVPLDIAFFKSWQIKCDDSKKKKGIV